MKIDFNDGDLKIKLDGDANECMQILSFVLRTNSCAPPSYIDILSIKNIERAATADKDTCSSVSDSKNTYKEIVSKNTPRRKLVMIMCNECEAVFGKALDTSENIHSVFCAQCRTTNTVTLNTLKEGSYICKCGASGDFMQDDDVLKVKCRDCKEDIYMLQSEDGKTFKGMISE